MTPVARRPSSHRFIAFWLALALALPCATLMARGQEPAEKAQEKEKDKVKEEGKEPEIERPAPPKLDDLESDRNRDGVPDGWYNLRDAAIMPEGGVVGPRFVRFQCEKQGRPARLSRAFGVDGQKYEAIVIGLWVRLERPMTGERVGEEPGLVIDFLGDQLRQLSRGGLGPWTSRTFASHTGWTRVAKRIPIPPGTHDAILSVGLLGATGVLDVDGLTFDLIPRGGERTVNLVRNGDFELGDPEPSGWLCDNGGRRGFPGFRSTAALELARSGARVMAGLALPVDRIQSLAISVMASGKGLRGAGGASAYMFFLDDDGRILPGLETGMRLFSWSGSFDWREDRTLVRVPEGATRAVIQFDKSDGLGSIKLDELAVSSEPGAIEWVPYHVTPDSDRWLAVEPSTGILENSALDFSFLLDGPAGKNGPVVVREGRFHFTKGGYRVRFLGVQLLPPTAYLDAKHADALAERLARSGVNLVRLGDLDAPLGPERSLYDDTRDDTDKLDQAALARLDHLVAALKARGIYVAVELQGARQFRANDGVTLPGALPPGGGPAAVFDPMITKKAENGIRALLDHVNPETGVAWKHEPALAWVTLAGELSLFDLITSPNELPADYAKALRNLTAQGTERSARRVWQNLEEAHWKGLADLLRKNGLKAPVAGVSHWRREREFAEAQAGAGLDLIDDRIFFSSPTWVSPSYRSMLWSLDGGLIPDATRKRKPDRPYVVGQWCDNTTGVWSSPYEAAEQILAARTAATEDWDALVRRGVFIYPEAWGSSGPGTFGGEDIFQIAEVANAEPHVFALWPHQASLLLRGQGPVRAPQRPRPEPPRSARGRRVSIPGWEPERGRLVVDTPYTQGIAGWPAGEVVTTDGLVVSVDNPYATVVASSIGDAPITRAKRLLVTAIGRIVPTGFAWADDWRRETADPGRPPLKQEPLQAKVLWKRKGNVHAYRLDNNGKRLGSAKLERDSEGARLTIDGDPCFHFELIVE